MIKRKLLSDLQAHLSKKEITMIVGPRQAGKTTLMQVLKDRLLAKGENVLYLNLDLEEDKRHFTSQLMLLSKIELEIGKSRGYVFIDEIQRKQDAGLFLKGLYDRNLPYKFVVSGSGSIELKEKIHESLAGRKQIFELTTVSFMEYVDYKTDYKYEHTLDLFFELEPEQMAILLENYLNFGGYPRVILEDRLDEKRKVIDEIFQSYINRDIGIFLKVAKLDGYTNMMRVLSAQSGGLVNLSELSNTLGLSLPTVSNYLWYAEKTFIVFKLTPHYQNKRKEITRSPVYYFTDPGFRNYASALFGLLNQEADYGFPFQGLILSMIRETIKYSGAGVYFWRTKDGAEVDFIVDYRVSRIPIEAKYKKLQKPEISRSLMNYIKAYEPEEVLIVNLTLEDVKKVEQTKVRFIPFYKLPAALER